MWSAVSSCSNTLAGRGVFPPTQGGRKITALARNITARIELKIIAMSGWLERARTWRCSDGMVLKKERAGTRRGCITCANVSEPQPDPSDCIEVIQTTPMTISMMDKTARQATRGGAYAAKRGEFLHHFGSPLNEASRKSNNELSVGMLYQNNFPVNFTTGDIQADVSQAALWYLDNRVAENNLLTLRQCCGLADRSLPRYSLWSRDLSRTVHSNYHLELPATAQDVLLNAIRKKEITTDLLERQMVKHLFILRKITSDSQITEDRYICDVGVFGPTQKHPRSTPQKLHPASSQDTGPTLMMSHSDSDELVEA